MINLLHRRSVRTVMVGFLVMLATSASWSQTTYDFTGLVTGGSFGTIGNWTPVGIPELMDTARFSLDQAYSVGFMSSPSHEELIVNNGDVTFQPQAMLEDLGLVYGISGGGTIDGGQLTIEGIDTEDLVVKVHGPMVVGDVANGVLGVNSGGHVQVMNDLTLGSEESSSGVLTVQGTGAIVQTMTFDDSLYVGFHGDGTLDVLGGGEVRVGGTVGIANIGNATGTVTVDGPGSRLYATNGISTLDVGFGGSGGVLNIANGGHVEVANARVGSMVGGHGAVDVDGIGSALMVANRLVVGAASSVEELSSFGSVTIGPGAVVGVAAETRLNKGSQLTIQGGTLSTSKLLDKGGDFNWDGGTVVLDDPDGYLVGTGDYQFEDDQLALEPAQSLTVTGGLHVPYSRGLMLTGGDLKVGSARVGGSGLLQLFGGHHDLGDGLMNYGLLALENAVIDGPVVGASGSAISVLGDIQFNELVSGLGEIEGSGTALFDGGHSPGHGPADISIASSVEYGAGNTLTIELAGNMPGYYDRLVIGQKVVLDGVIRVELLDGYLPGVGDQFEVISAALRDGVFSRVAGTKVTPEITLVPLYDFGGNIGLTLKAGIQGDANFDGLIDITDLGIAGANFNMTGREWDDGDFNFDGVTDVDDLGVIGAAWSQIQGLSSGPLSGGDGSSVVVPEPGTFACAGMWLFLASIFRRIHR